MKKSTCWKEIFGALVTDKDFASRIYKGLLIWWRRTSHPDRCGSVGWATFSKAKGCGFNSQSGNMPELQMKSLARARKRGNHTLMFLSLSFSLPSLLSKNKLIKPLKNINKSHAQWEKWIIHIQQEIHRI